MIHIDRSKIGMNEKPKKPKNPIKEYGVWVCGEHLIVKIEGEIKRPFEKPLNAGNTCLVCGEQVIFKILKLTWSNWEIVKLDVAEKVAKIRKDRRINSESNLANKFPPSEPENVIKTDFSGGGETISEPVSYPGSDHKHTPELGTKKKRTSKKKKY